MAIEAAGGLVWRPIDGARKRSKWRWCTGPSTTTGRCPRASSNPASTRCWQRFARSKRSPVPGWWSGGRSARRATPWTDGPNGCSTGHCAGRAVSSARTTRSTRWTGCRSRRPVTGSSPTGTDSSWTSSSATRDLRAPASSYAMRKPEAGRRGRGPMSSGRSTRPAVARRRSSRTCWRPTACRGPTPRMYGAAWTRSSRSRPPPG